MKEHFLEYGVGNRNYNYDKTYVLERGFKPIACCSCCCNYPVPDFVSHQDCGKGNNEGYYYCCYIKSEIWFHLLPQGLVHKKSMKFGVNPTRRSKNN